MSNYHITTTITAVPFRCVVCGYVDEVLHTRRETDDPWAVMLTVDTVHQLIGASDPSGQLRDTFKAKGIGASDKPIGQLRDTFKAKG
jgi:hypothetical protein